MKLVEESRALWAVSTLFIALLVALTLASAPAFAQGNSVITGTARDASSKAPLVDVVVTATSPALQGEQTVITDGTGHYRIPQLPPGDYTLRFDKEAFTPAARGQITVRVGSTIRVNMELRPDPFTPEEDYLIPAPSVIELWSAQMGTSVGSELVSRIALSPPSVKGSVTRSFESMADVAPTVHTDMYGMSISGTTSPENQYIIDGISVNDPGFGLIGTPLSVEFVKEMNVITGAYLPEYGRATGGVLDVVTKSGSNELHGSMFMSITPGGLEGPRTLVRKEGQTITLGNSLSSLRDFGVELGGPIRKDKLWFYVGVSPSFASYRLERNLARVVVENGAPKVDRATGFTVTDNIPGTTRIYAATQTNFQYIAKLTYLINRDQNVSLSVFGGPSTSGGDGGFGIRPQTGEVESLNTPGSYTNLAHKLSQSSNEVALKYSAAFLNKRLLLDVTLGWHHGYRAQLPSDGSAIGSKEGLAALAGVDYRRTAGGFHNINEFEYVPNNACAPVAGKPNAMGNPTTINVCPVATYTTGGPGLIDDADLNRYQGKAIVTWLLWGFGHHVIKAGIDIEAMSFDHRRAYSGTTFLRENTAGTNFADFRRFGSLVGPDEVLVLDVANVSSTSLSIGGFLQDSWDIFDKVTLSAGLRYDAQILSANGETGMVLPNQISPRVGLIYDFTHFQKSKIFVNYARYYENIPLDLADRSLTRGGQTRTTHIGNAQNGLCDPRTLAGQQGGCSDPANFLESADPSNPSRHWGVTGGSKSPVDPEINPQSTDELSVGAEFEVFPAARVGAQYTKRFMNDIIEDMSRDEGHSYFLGNPGVGIAKDFPKAHRDYDAGTIYFNKVFWNGWLAQASYTLSYLRGNWAGLFRPETGQLDPNINSDFDLISLVTNRTGPLPGDMTHQLKIFAAKDFSVTKWLDVNGGLTFRTRSGEPTNYLGAHPSYGVDEAFLLPRGSGPRMPWVHGFDTHVGVSVKLAKGSTLVVGMDIFNLFNFQAVTAVDHTYTRAEVRPVIDGKVSDVPGASTTECVPATCKLVYRNGDSFKTADRNPNFGNPVQYQAPRTFRFTAKVLF